MAEEGGESPIRFACPRCLARLKARPAAAGTRHRCPVCQVIFVAPTAAEVAAMQARVRQLGEYPVHEGGAEGAEGRAAEYLPVICPVCATRMYATPDQVGQELQCPDCFTQVVVPPAPEALPAESLPAEQVGPEDIYAICEWDWRSPPAQPQYIAVTCGVCRTRMLAAPEQVGQRLVCPDCGTAAVVPRPRDVALPVAPPLVRDEYRVGRPVERTPVNLAAFARLGVAERWFNAQRQRPKPPRWPFLSGVLDFPFYPGTLARWLGLSLLALLIAEFLLLGVKLGGREAGLPWLVSMGLFSASGVLLLILLVATSVICLAILLDTAAGCDQIEAWPDAVWLDWAPYSLYVVNSLAVTALAGVLATAVFRACAWPEWPAAALGAFLFPVVLLSTLETGSMWDPLSAPVWRSLAHAWWAWALFYLESSLVAAGAGWVIWQAVGFASMPGRAVASLVLVAALMLYFRLLGRVAWCCSERGSAAGRPKARDLRDAVPERPLPKDPAEV